MDKEQKQAAVKEIGEALESANAVFAVDYRGISVPQAAELRGKLREADASFNVVKNRLAKRVTADSGSEALDEHLTGPTALTYVKGDPVIAAKAITDFIREHETISYKGGIMEGKFLDPDQFKAIVRLPGVDVLRGQLTGLVATPITGLVRGLNGLIQGLATSLARSPSRGWSPAKRRPRSRPPPRKLLRGGPRRGRGSRRGARRRGGRGPRRRGGSGRGGRCRRRRRARGARRRQACRRG